MEIVLYILLGILAIIVGYILFFVLSILLFIRNKEYNNVSKFYKGLFTFTIGVVLFVINVKVEVKGLEKLEGLDKFLLVSNHRSNYDPIVKIRAFRKYDIAFISKKENFKLPVIGKLIRRLCFMPIDRENPRNAILTIRRASNLIKQDVASIAVYPEGTRSKECKLLELHDGVLKIAQHASVPIVVVATSGTEKIHKRTPFRRTKVLLDIVDVLSTEIVTGKTSHELGEVIKSDLKTALENK